MKSKEHYTGVPAVSETLTLQPVYSNWHLQSTNTISPTSGGSNTSVTLVFD